MGLILVLVGALLFAAWNSYKDNIRQEGRDEITEQVEADNEKLEDHVTQVNENIVRRVTTTTEKIDRRSRIIEDAINDQPSEPITNVTKSRLDLVREQQRAVRQADSKAEWHYP